MNTKIRKLIIHIEEVFHNIGVQFDEDKSIEAHYLRWKSSKTAPNSEQDKSRETYSLNVFPSLARILTKTKIRKPITNTEAFPILWPKIWRRQEYGSPLPTLKVFQDLSKFWARQKYGSPLPKLRLFKDWSKFWPNWIQKCGNLLSTFKLFSILASYLTKTRIQRPITYSESFPRFAWILTKTEVRKPIYPDWRFSKTGPNFDEDKDT